MDIPTKRLNAATRKLNKILDAVHSELVQIKKHLASEEQRHKTTEQQNGTVQRSFSVDVDKPIYVQQDPEYKYQIDRDWTALIISIATFVVVASYTAFSYHQWQAMEMQTGLLKEAANRSVIDSVATNARFLRQLKIEQRAWVIHHGGIQQLIFGPDQDFVITVVVANDGKSPALNVVTDIHSVLLPRFEKPKFDYPKDFKGENVLAPFGGTAGLTNRGLHVNAIDYRMLKDNWKNLYVYGFANYKDIFGDPHKTTFCLMLNNATIGSPSGPTFGTCPWYEHSD